MPDSMSTDELKRLRAIYPAPPYREHLYQYSYFMGDTPGQDQAAISNRKLVRGSTQPIIRLRKHENVSSKQPYVAYDDVELDPGPPQDDGFPFQSYYYLMDYDDKGPVALKPGQVVMVPSSRLRGMGYKVTKPSRLVRAPQQKQQPVVKREKSIDTFITLEGWW